MRPSRTWRLSARALRRSKPVASSISETRQQALGCAIVLLLPEPHPQPLLMERSARQLARSEGPGQQQVAALIIHLDDERLAMGEDLDLVLLREGQPDVEGVARALLLDLHGLLAEEDLGGVGVAEHVVRKSLEQLDSDHLAVEEARLEHGKRIEGLARVHQVAGLDGEPAVEVLGARR